MKIIGPLLLFYPLWGLPCLVLICRKLAGIGTRVQRAVWATFVAAVSPLIFTPVLFGTEGFGLFAPWPIIFWDPEHSFFWWPLAVAVFLIAFISNVSSGRKIRSDR